MKKNYITKISIVLLAIILLVIGIFVGRKSVKANQKGVNISNEFFEKDSRDYIKNMTVYNDESVSTDGLIYTLESSVYIKECNIGYYVISIRQENGKTDIISSINYMLSMGGRAEKLKLEGDTLYFSFVKTEMWEEDVLEIADYRGNIDTDNVIRFNVVNNESIDVKTFSNDEYECSFSAIGFSILHSDDKDIEKVKIKYDDGTEKTIFYFPRRDIEAGTEDFDNTVICDTAYGWTYFDDRSWNTPSEMNRFTYLFNKLYDTEKISSVTVNGEELKLTE